MDNRDFEGVVSVEDGQNFVVKLAADECESWLLDGFLRCVLGRKMAQPMEVGSGLRTASS